MNKYILLDVNGTVGTDEIPLLERLENPDNFVWIDKVLAHIKLSTLERIKELSKEYNATVLWTSLRADDSLCLNPLVDVNWGWLDVNTQVDRSNEWSKTIGVAPREIMGEAAFKKVKAEVQARADHHCEICGRYVAHTIRTQDWIHTHEVYHVNHNEHLYTFQEFVGICQECHLFIHQGYLHTLLTEDSITEKYYDDVIQHGTELLKLIKGYKVPNLNLEDVYMMEYEGEYYINDFYPEVAKALYEDGVHILHYHGVEKTLPEEMYYKPK